MGKSHFWLEQSGRLPGGGGTRVEPVKISLGEGERRRGAGNGEGLASASCGKVVGDRTKNVGWVLTVESAEVL